MTVVSGHMTAAQSILLTKFTNCLITLVLIGCLSSSFRNLIRKVRACRRVNCKTSNMHLLFLILYLPRFYSSAEGYPYKTQGLILISWYICLKFRRAWSKMNIYSIFGNWIIEWADSAAQLPSIRPWTPNMTLLYAPNVCTTTFGPPFSTFQFIWEIDGAWTELTF